MTTSDPVYRVTVSREDNLWVAVVDGIPGGATDVDRVVDMEPEVRDLIAGLRDVDPFDFEIEWHYEQGGRDLTSAVCELRHREADAEEAAMRRDDARRYAIREMQAADMSMRTIAEVVGLSHQRVQQLVSSAEKAG